MTQWLQDLWGNLAENELSSGCQIWACVISAWLKMLGRVCRAKILRHVAFNFGLY